MNPQTYQAVLDCLLDRPTSRTAPLFARRVCRVMLGTSGPIQRISPVFTRMNGYHPGWFLPGSIQDGTLRLPVRETAGLPSGQALRERMNKALSAVSKEESQLGLLLDTLEQYGSPVPAAEDISEYDYRKMTAAVCACAAEYPGQLTDTEPVFLLYTADFCGIQKFIYTVSTTNALKALRSRSFFLELVMEHYIDELLSACGLSRVNLLYSGGGHCYMLLPNTEAVLAAASQWNTRFNNWLSTHFGTSLYLADGYTPCCANDLNNTPASQAPYQAMFRRVSSSVSRKKVTRYSPDQIRRLNRQAVTASGRECQICGTQSRLTTDAGGRSVCKWCGLFETLSSKILKSEIFIVHKGTDRDFTLPGYLEDAGFTFCSEADAGKRVPSGDIRRVYGKNRLPSGFPYSVRLFVGDYAAETQTELLAQSSEGIPRIGICRMDVDNLGQSFVAGFEQKEGTPEQRQKYVNLIRTGAFSRQMSLFFKGYVNQILSGSFENRLPLTVSIVYSGGDDVFLIGAWTDVMEAALRIRNAFRRFTCGSLTLSAGVCLFQDHHPIRLAANQTAELEDEAKSLPNKDGISIFAADQGHVFTWEDYEHHVRDEKLRLLQRFFLDPSGSRGNSFLYHIADLLRQANAYPGKGIPLARLAYLLARLQPRWDAPEARIYPEFSQKIYQWALDPQQRRQLITAIYLHVYQTRKVRDGNEQ